MTDRDPLLAALLAFVDELERRVRDVVREELERRERPDEVEPERVDATFDDEEIDW